MSPNIFFLKKNTIIIEHTDAPFQQTDEGRFRGEVCGRFAPSASASRLTRLPVRLLLLSCTHCVCVCVCLQTWLRGQEGSEPWKL
jgi:hypothetical protein